MSIYAFTCSKTPECPEEFTVNQSMDLKKHEAVCPVCGSPAKRVLFSTPVHFHGRGFYSTDYPKH